MQAVRTIQARPSRSSRWQKQGGWELYEGDGVSPMSCGPSGREDALSYARQRVGYAPTESDCSGKCTPNARRFAGSNKQQLSRVGRNRIKIGRTAMGIWIDASANGALKIGD